MSTHVLARLSAMRRTTRYLVVERRHPSFNGCWCDRQASEADYFDALTLARRGL